MVGRVYYLLQVLFIRFILKLAETKDSHSVVTTCRHGGCLIERQTDYKYFPFLIRARPQSQGPIESVCPAVRPYVTTFLHGLHTQYF